MSGPRSLTSSFAPAPGRGWMRAAYKSIQEANGWVDVNHIRKNMSRFMEPGELVTEQRVDKTISNCLTTGYIMRDEFGRYSIAPLHIYTQMQALREAGKGTLGPRKKKVRKKRDAAVFIRPFWHWSTAGTAVIVAFGAGFVCALVAASL